VPVDRALNAIDIAATLGRDDPEVRSEVVRARTVLEGVGSGPYLATPRPLRGRAWSD
jgi:hypothetical protein